jgi:hypothetical protein
MTGAQKKKMKMMIWMMMRMKKGQMRNPRNNLFRRNQKSKRLI